MIMNLTLNVIFKFLQLPEQNNQKKQDLIPVKYIARLSDFIFRILKTHSNNLDLMILNLQIIQLFSQNKDTQAELYRISLKQPQLNDDLSKIQTFHKFQSTLVQLINDYIIFMASGGNFQKSGNTG